MSDRSLRRVLIVYLLLLVPLGWLAMRYDRYAIDGDAVSYMDIADLLHAHRWSGAVNAYWHPLYPALLWMAQSLLRPTRATELKAYYAVNAVLLAVQVVAILLFVRALVRLRDRVSPSGSYLLSLPALQLLATSLLVIAVLRELSLGKVRTDSLLQALILFGFALLMETLAAARTGPRLLFAAGMGLSFGLAYLTKSFAFLLGLLCMVVLVAFAAFVQKRRWLQAAAPVAVAFLVFAAVAGPYIAALSWQKHRFDFGDSGTLNYAWYVSRTEKMHLEPWMTGSFGSASVHLLHPERRLLEQPGIYSYKALPYGTYPPWFDATYFNERVTPRFNLGRLASQDARNIVLIVRYLFNHPEPLILLGLLLAGGATFRGNTRFAWPVAGLGVAMWAIYATVNIEERYVTVAYFAVLLPVFAALQVKAGMTAQVASVRRIACFLVLTLSLLMLGEMLRQGLANRREEIAEGLVPAWRNPGIFGTAEGLTRMGVKPGDEIACIGTNACLYDPYWARLAGVRILTEIYDPVPEHLIDHLDAMPERERAYKVLQREGARVLIGVFDPGEMNASHPAAAGWERLGETNYYALPLEAR